MSNRDVTRDQLEEALRLSQAVQTLKRQSSVISVETDGIHLDGPPSWLDDWVTRRRGSSEYSFESSAIVNVGPSATGLRIYWIHE